MTPLDDLDAGLEDESGRDGLDATYGQYRYAMREGRLKRLTDRELRQRVRETHASLIRAVASAEGSDGRLLECVRALNNLAAKKCGFEDYVDYACGSRTSEEPDSTM